MQMEAPSVQTETEGLEGVVQNTENAADNNELLLNGPAPVMWAGFGAFILIFLIGMMLIIRGRVVGAPANRNQKRSKKQNKGETRNYFEPAGEDVDIRFDDEDDELSALPSAWRDDRDDETEVVIDRGDGDFTDDAPEEDFAFDEPPAPKKKKSAFAGLFSKKAAPEPEPVEEDAAYDEYEDYDDAQDGHEAQDDYQDAGYLREPEPAPAPAPIREPQPDYNRQAAPAFSDNAFPESAGVDEQRLAQAEDTAKLALRRAEGAEALARDLQRANQEAERVLTLGLRDKAAALDERADTLAAMEKRIASLTNEFQSRMKTVNNAAQLAAEQAKQAAQHAAQQAAAPAPMAVAATHDSHQGVSDAHFEEFADLMGERFDALRNTVNSAIERLSKRLDHLPVAAPGTGTTTAARVQLADLLSDALPPQRYKLGHKLSSGRTAEAVISMPGPIAPIAVDARFPVEAFDAWRHDPTADTANELRRVVLRHIADAAEKLIAPGETADGAMMFIPAEHILSELHAHFSDLVQESYRARVWMTAPTSLMATLHTISAVMGSAGHDMGMAASGGEIDALRNRVAALEARRENGAHPPAQKAPEPEQGVRINPAQYTDVFGGEPRKAATPGTSKDPGEKSPFPLR